MACLSTLLLASLTRCTVALQAAAISVHQARHGRTEVVSVAGHKQNIAGLRGASSAYVKSADWQRPPGWFAGFDQAESTYDEQGEGADLRHNPEKVVEDGWQPPGVFKDQWSDRQQDYTWFHESVSGGGYEAYQSHYPTVQGSASGNREVHGNPWRHTAGSWDPQGWVQDYNPETYRTYPWTSRNEARWFDSSVKQLDGFGRPMIPRDYLGHTNALGGEGWIERGVNSTLTCADPGCSGASSLQVYNPANEEISNCRFNFVLHPTDFDEEYSEEFVEYIKLNSATAKRNCFPAARGCNTTAWERYYSCLTELPVDNLIGSDGRLTVEAKISEMVDECAYQNQLLYAVVSVVCMVRDIPPAPTVATTTTLAYGQDLSINATAPLQCENVSCVAQRTLVYNSYPLLSGGRCYLTVTVNQTDYDQDESAERIEYIAVNGVNISTNLAPGSNPCLNDMQGVTNTASDYVYTAINNKDITSQALLNPGYLVLTGQNSVMVDECASQGFLFDALATIECSYSSSNSNNNR